MGDGIQISHRIAVTYKNTFAACLFKPRVVSLGFGSESIHRFKRNRASVNRQSVIIGNSNIFGTAFVFLTVVPVFVITGTTACFRTFKGAGEFLTGMSVVREPAVFVHSQTRFAYGIA